MRLRTGWKYAREAIADRLGKLIPGRASPLCMSVPDSQMKGIMQPKFGFFAAMDNELRAVSKHMSEFAGALFGHAMWHSIMTGMGSTPRSEVFGLIHVAHGGELLLKAAIAKEHPLLIFSKTPSPDQFGSPRLTFEALVHGGRTITYKDLPNTLWAATGYRLPDIDTYNRIGDLRNAIQHFAVQQANYRCEVLSYICQVAEPVFQHFWDVGVFRVIVDGWSDQDSYLFDDEPWVKEAIEECGIEFSGWVPTPENRR